MKTTYNAQSEKEMNAAIYGEMTKHARRAFEFVKIEPGQYNAAQVVAAIDKYKASFVWGKQDPEEVVTVAVGTYQCKYLLKNAFDMLAKVATAWGIPTAARATFERAKETAPTVCAFDVPKAAANVTKIIDKKSPYVSLRYAYIDINRRALVGACDCMVTVAALPTLATADGTNRPGFLVAPSLLKSGRVAIDTNDKAANGGNVADAPKINFPAWSSVFPDIYDADAVKFDRKTAAALKKAVAAAAKYSDETCGGHGMIKMIAIYGEAHTNKIIVRARKTEHIISNHGDRETVTYRDYNVTTPETLQQTFVLPIDGKRYATLPAFDTLYIPTPGLAMVVTGKDAAALLMPVLLPEDWEAPTNANYHYSRPRYAKKVAAIDTLLSIQATPVSLEDDNEPTAAANVETDAPAADIANEPTAAANVETANEPTAAANVETDAPAADIDNEPTADDVETANEPTGTTTPTTAPQSTATPTTAQQPTATVTTQQDATDGTTAAPVADIDNEPTAAAADIVETSANEPTATAAPADNVETSDNEPTATAAAADIVETSDNDNEPTAAAADNVETDNSGGDATTDGHDLPQGSTPAPGAAQGAAAQIIGVTLFIIGF